jgi:hypothetical protein
MHWYIKVYIVLIMLLKYFWRYASDGMKSKEDTGMNSVALVYFYIHLVVGICSDSEVHECYCLSIMCCY